MFEKSKSVLGLWLSELETPFEAVGPSRPAPKSPRGLSGCQGLPGCRGRVRSLCRDLAL